MPFTTPLALLGLLFIPAVVAMYLLKLRRDETIVPSTLLWSRLVADVEANAPWQKLRRSLLLLLQLLLVAILALLAARPFLERPAGLARDVVLVLDTSASMAATDITPDRLTAAKAAAIGALRDLPTGGKVSVIAADRSARIVVNETTDLGRVRQALDGIAVTSGRGDLGDALELAGKLAARSGDAQILVATDGALATPIADGATVPAKVTVLPVGRERKNQAIVALAVRTAPSAVTRSVFVSVANLDLERAARRLEVWGDGGLIEVRDLLLEPQARSDVVIDDVPRDVGTLELRLVGPDAGVTSAPDQLAVDDHAWAIVPPDRERLILVVGPGDPYLETALSYLPNVELFGVTTAEYGPATERQDGRPWDLVIFEGALPATLPRSPILAIGPTATSDLGVVTGTLTNPGIGSLDPAEPILRYVDLSTTHIASAAKMTVPDWARTVIPGPSGAPLLYVGSRDGLPTAVMAFEPRRSDLPLQVAFPVLLANLTGELLGGSSAPTEAVQPGTPVTLAIPAGATGLTVTRPDGERRGARAGHPARHHDHLRGDRPAGRLRRHAAARAGGIGRAVGLDRGRRRERATDARRQRDARRFGCAGVGGDRPRHQPTRTRRSASRWTCSTSTSRPSRRARSLPSRPSARSPAHPGHRAHRPHREAARPRSIPVRPPGTSCGARSFCWSSSACASSGPSTTVMR